jgi:hypothetical protein
MGQPNWNTVMPSLENTIYMPSIVKQAAEVKDEVIIAAEADTAAGDNNAKEAKVQEEPTLTV